jgi:hypothetical protein
MKRVSAKFVPRILTPEQKEQSLSISLELRDRVTSDPNFFQNLITGDESWVYGYDPETKVQGFTMENTQLASAEEGAPIESQCQSHVDCLFRPVGDCAVGVRTQWHYSQLCIL